MWIEMEKGMRWAWDGDKTGIEIEPWINAGQRQVQMKPEDLPLPHESGYYREAGWRGADMDHCSNSGPCL